jgi:glutathione S-transferase
VSLTLYDADRCPFCARVRIVLAEKAVDYAAVPINLADRPDWMYEKNPTGKVPVLEEGDLVLPESAVIMEYLEERVPEPALLPASAEERALARVWIDRFDDRLGEVYYAVRRGAREQDELEAQLEVLNTALVGQPYLTGSAYGLADIAYIPWILRLESALGLTIEAFPALSDWVERLSQRLAVSAEVEVVSALPR